MRACAHLLQQASTAQSGACSQAVAVEADAALQTCWAWCLQEVACDVLTLEQRSLELERLEHAAAAAGGRNQHVKTRPVNPARTAWRSRLHRAAQQPAAEQPPAEDQPPADQPAVDPAAAFNDEVDDWEERAEEPAGEVPADEQSAAQQCNGNSSQWQHPAEPALLRATADPVHVADGQWQNEPAQEDGVWLDGATAAVEDSSSTTGAAANGQGTAHVGDAQQEPDAARGSNDDDTAVALGAKPDPVLASFISQWCRLVEVLSSGDRLSQDNCITLLNVFDGRLWHFMLHCASMSKPTGLSLRTLRVAEGMMRDICQAAGVAEAEVSAAIASLMADTPSVAAEPRASTNRPCIHHRVAGNPLVDALLGRPDTAAPGIGLALATEELRVFRDTYHWHSGRPIEPAYIGETWAASLQARYAGADLSTMARCPALREAQRRRLQAVLTQEDDPELWTRNPERRSQRLASALQQAFSFLRENEEYQRQTQARFLRDYADTLSSTQYRTATNNTNGLVAGNGGGNARRGGRNAGGGGNSVNAVIQANVERRAIASETHRAETWQQLQSKLQSHSDVHNGCWDGYMASAVREFLAGCKDKPTATQTFLAAVTFQLAGEVRSWKQQCSTQAAQQEVPNFDSSADMSAAINIWTIVQGLLELPKLRSEADAATTTAIQKAWKQCLESMQVLGFAKAAEVVQQLVTAPPRPASAKQAGARFHVGMTEAEFQLQFCGDILQRVVPACLDTRVASFNPDLWQREVLDATDDKASCVVCAPTSSGKTFISSYCIDRVLKESTEGIVVFVAPTKALVNQTAAQVSLTIP